MKHYSAYKFSIFSVFGYLFIIDMMFHVKTKHFCFKVFGSKFNALGSKCEAAILKKSTPTALQLHKAHLDTVSPFLESLF